MGSEVETTQLKKDNKEISTLMIILEPEVNELIETISRTFLLTPEELIKRMILKDIA